MRKLILGSLIISAITGLGFALLASRQTIIEPTQNNNEADLKTATSITATATSAATSSSFGESLPTAKLIPGNQIKQGDTLRVILQNYPSNQNLVFQNKTYPLFKYGGEWNALIPIAVTAPLGSTPFTFGSSTENILIQSGNFPVVPIKMPILITNPQTLAEYRAEKENILAAYNASAPENYFIKPFGFPLAEIKITNPFGITYLNEKNGSKTFHNGIDLKAAVGTPVMAINDGVVKIAADYLLEGKFVMLDHGKGVFSDYLHLSKIMVKPGEKVTKGQVIGLSGETGEAVGPHLHFMIKINDVPVDPLAFIKLWE